MPWGNWASTISTSVSSRVDASAGMRRAQKCTDCGTSPTRPRRSLAQAERQTLKSSYYSKFPKLLFAYCAAQYPWPAEFAKVGRRGDAVRDTKRFNASEGRARCASRLSPEDPASIWSLKLSGPKIMCLDATVALRTGFAPALPSTAIPTPRAQN
jgi:hypothetical protein